jgi:CBS domain-containing protein
MRVADLMKKHAITCTDGAVLSDATRLMWQHDIGFIPVVSAESGTLVGVITDRDAIMAAWSQDKPVSQIPVRGVMCTRVVTCHPENDAFEAEQLMRKLQLRRLPVTSAQSALIGVVSLNDLARRAAREGDAWLEENVSVTLSAISEPRHTH